MTRQRAVPLLLAAAAALIVGCNVSTELSTVPYGFVTVVAQKAVTGHSTSPVGTFYDAGGLGVPTAIAPWDSCRLQSYTSTAPLTIGQFYPSISAGAAIQVKLASRTDSLFPVAVGPETQYRLRSPAAVPYTPGDSVGLVIPGAGSGYPAVTVRAKTAEVLAVTEFAAPASGSRLDLRWNAGHDLNNTVTFSFRYGALSADTLNSQVYCQFKDDGADSIPSKYIAAWAAARTKSWAASRVRTYVAPVARGGYFDFISTFDLPTPIAP
ncbi:MAG: hypothetical protein P3B98_07210 [Gemmatimonadota bacterium]|nr:hypothetical protein [Gemmatimonadota bacterium]